MRRAALVFIFLTVLLDMLALGIIAPVLPKLVIALEGGDKRGAAALFGLFGTVWAAMQFLFAPLLGALSDRFGRRPVILLSCLGLGLDYIVMALAPTVGWLFVGRVVSGITASSFATSFAYIADVTPPDQRAGKFGMLSAAFGIGFILGPAGGWALGGDRAPGAVLGGGRAQSGGRGLRVFRAPRVAPGRAPRPVRMAARQSSGGARPAALMSW
jgi:MFS transporter, DHA1 family, tetracycline resistance protein